MTDSTGKQETLTTQTFRSLRWSGLSVVIQGILQFLALVLLSRVLSPRDFGLYSIVMIFTAIVERVGHLGTGPALIQKQEISDEHVRIAFSVSVIIGLGMYAAYWFSAHIIAASFGEPEVAVLLRICGLCFVIDSLCAVPESLLQRELRFRELTWIEALSYGGGNLLVSFVLACMGWQAFALVFGALTGRGIRLACLLPKSPPRFSVRLFGRESRELFRLASGFTLGRVLNYLALNGDKLVVGALLGTHVLGLYSRAYQLIALPVDYISRIVDRVLFPAMARRQDNRTSMVRTYSLMVEIICLLTLPVSVVFLFAADEVIQVVFGAGWSEAAPALQALAIGVFLRGGYKSADTLGRAMGRVFSVAGRQAVYAVTVVLFSALGARLAGLAGVGIGVSTALAITWIAALVLSKRLLAISWSQLWSMLAPGAAVAAGAVIPVSITALFTSSLPAWLALGATLFSAALGCLLVLSYAPLTIRLTCWDVISPQLSGLSKNAFFFLRRSDSPC